jgi:hypothetical protein
MVSLMNHEWGKLGQLFILVVMMGFFSNGALANNSKINDLQQKVADMALIHHQLNDRVEQAKMIREKLRHQNQTFLDEIDDLRQQHRIKTYKQADQNLRIHYNIRLIASIEAYLRQVQSKIFYLETGQDKLAYLQKLASDDIRMIGALNDLEIDALTTQISLVINQYLAEAHVLQIDTQLVTPSSPETIWNSIEKRN